MKFTSLKLASMAVFALAAGLTPLQSSQAAQYDVKFVGCVDSGTCYIGINPPLMGPMPAGCTMRDQVRFNVNGAAGQALYNLAMAALMSGYKLDVTHHQSANTCIDGFARVWYMGPTK
jgi:hypothetical protein